MVSLVTTFGDSALWAQDFKTALAEAWDAHTAKGCMSEPRFAQDDRFGVSTLVMTCEGCSLTHVVI